MSWPVIRRRLRVPRKRRRVLLHLFAALLALLGTTPGARPARPAHRRARPRRRARRAAAQLDNCTIRRRRTAPPSASTRRLTS